MNWKARAANVRFNVQPFIDGRYCASTSSEVFESINPATETTLYTSSVGSAVDIEAAVRSARLRFNDGCWSELPPERRGEIISKFADLVVAHAAELALFDSLEMGKPIKSALLDAGMLAAKTLRSCAALATRLLGESAPLIGGNTSFSVYEPRGVVGAITPWNFPTVNAVYKCGPALAAGNSVVLKPSEIAPSSALRLAELALEAGIPEGVLNVVPGRGPTVGLALAQHPDIDLLSFTGSTATGRRIMELAGKSNGKPVLLECGGKSPHVVFDDIKDIELAAKAGAHSILWNQGQVCIAHNRVIVHERIKEALLEGIVQHVRQHRLGDPLEETTTFGPLASPSQRDRVKKYIQQGIEAGALAVLHTETQEIGGCYISPTIFDRVHACMSIVQEEIFGPVMCIQTFQTEGEAIALANGTMYGLMATIWTRELSRGMRLAHAIRAGEVAIRTGGEEGEAAGCGIYGEPQKASGFGCEFGTKGLQAYSTLKAITITGG